MPQPLKWIFSKLRRTMQNILMTHVNNCTTGFVKGNDVFFLFFFLFFKEDQKNDFFLIIQLNKDRKIPMQTCGNYLERLTDG